MTPNNFRVKNGLTVSNGINVTAGNVVISGGQLVIGATAINANSMGDSAATAYTNAIAIAANATNLTSGTVPFARLPSLYLGTTAIQSTSAAQAVSGITTLAAGNTTISGFANVTSGLSLSNATSNFIDWSTAGVQGPSINSRSPGTKLLLYPALSASQTDYAIGISPATIWSTVPGAEDSFKFKWYGADIEVASLSGAGNMVLSGSINAASHTVGTSFVANTSRVVIGTAVGLQANGGIGTAGQVLHSNGTTVYWAADDGITSLVAANGLSGGTITSTGTISVLGGSTLTVNSTGIHVNSALSIGDLILSGNLTVSGTRTYVNTTTLDVGDNIITLNADLGASAPSQDAGIEIMRGTSANVQFMWDETNDRWSTNGQPLAVSSLIAAGAASGITTLAAGNTTITGFANVVSTGGAQAAAALRSGTYGTFIVPQASAGAYNNLTGNNDNLIYFSNGTINGGNLLIGTWTDRAAGYGVKLTGSTFDVSVVANSLTIAANVSITAGSVLNWNNDAGISRSSASTLSIGNGTNNDSSGQLNLAKIYLLNGNITSPSTGIIQFGTGATSGTGAQIQSAGASFSANVVMANNNITRPVLTGYTEHEVANAAVTGTFTMDCGAANFFDLTLTGNTTISPSNVPPSTRVWSGSIAAKQDATGGRTITWPTGTKYAGGVAPPATTTANALDIWSLMTYDGGTSWIVSLSVKGVA